MKTGNCWRGSHGTCGKTGTARKYNEDTGSYQNIRYRCDCECHDTESE